MSRIFLVQVAGTTLVLNNQVIRLAVGSGFDNSGDIALNTAHREIVSGNPHGSGLPIGGGAGDSIIKVSTTDFDFTILKNNLGAITAPTVDNDSSEGYAVKSRWTDLAGANVYECIDATVGAAVWLNLSESGGGGGEWTEIERRIISSPVAAADFTDVFTDDYDTYLVEIVHMGDVSTGSWPTLIFGYGATTWVVSGYDYHLQRPTSTSGTYVSSADTVAAAMFIGSVLVGSDRWFTTTLTINNLRDASAVPTVRGDGIIGVDSGSVFCAGSKTWGSLDDTTNKLDHLRIGVDSGTFSQALIVISGKNT